MEFLSGSTGKTCPLELRHPDGTPIRGQHAAWDLMLHRWNEQTILYAGVMTPTGKRREARWPEDNWTRRVYAFRQNSSGQWVRETQPLFGGPTRKSWIGHCYGHHFLEDESGKTWVFYERVTRELKVLPTPYVTEIFARPMLSPLVAGEPEIPILGIGDPPYPATPRTIGGFLVEGPHPVRVTIEGKPIYILGFSSGDFPTESYGINVAFSHHALGPYVPLLAASPEGPDFIDFGRSLRSRYALAWGPARPCFFSDPAGHWWVLFHAVSKAILPDHDYSRWPGRALHHFHRNIYLAPVRFEMGPENTPQIVLRA